MEAKLIISGGVWATRPVAEQPHMQLIRWSVWEVGDGEKTTRHFVGYNVLDGEGRVSSKIIDFDPATKRGRTHSGRIYELVGHPSYDQDGMYVWGRWLRANSIDDSRDVTDQVMG